MKQILGLGALITGGLILIFALVIGVMYSMKVFNSVTAIERTVQVDDNVKCFVVTSTDGIATDCWKINE